MKMNMIRVFICVVVTFLIACLYPNSLKADSNKKVIGYYAEWSRYARQFFPKDIKADLLTHINYAFVKVNTQGDIVWHDVHAAIDADKKWNEERPYWGNLLQLNQLKQRHPHLKTLISVGGWNDSYTFSDVVANPQTRQRLVESCIAFCEKYSFDGVDIDWEYPGYAEHGGKPCDKENFTLFIQELHEAVKSHQPPLLLTIAAPAGPFHYTNIDISAIHPYLDWINLMTYDFHGPWGGEAGTNHLSGLYPTQEGHPLLNVDSAVMHYISQGVPLDKIVLGMAFYGRAYAGVSKGPDGLFSPFTGCAPPTLAEEGMRFYYEIKNSLLPHYQRFWDDESMVPYLYSASRKEFITYEDDISIGLKAQYIKEKQLGGAMIWELGLDVRPEWELLKAIHKGMK